MLTVAGDPTIVTVAAQGADVASAIGTREADAEDLAGTLTRKEGQCRQDEGSFSC